MISDPLKMRGFFFLQDDGLVVERKLKRCSANDSVR